MNDSKSCHPINIDYSHRLTAFVDILGFRMLIQQPQDMAKLTIENINNTLSHALKIIKSDNTPNSISVKIFSDCLCISAEPAHCREIIYELAYIQLWFAIHGIFVRGAITEGLHFENENMIFSQGLIKAYDYEKQAQYPRILIESSLAAAMIEDTGSDYIMLAPDHLYFIDYLELLAEEGMSDPEEMLERHKTEILTQIKNNCENVGVLAKYRWLSEYHNLKANQLLIFEDYENDYAAQLRENTLIPIASYFPDFRKPTRGNHNAVKEV
jgi:hypothetical protein